MRALLCLAEEGGRVLLMHQQQLFYFINLLLQIVIVAVTVAIVGFRPLRPTFLGVVMVVLLFLLLFFGLLGQCSRVRKKEDYPGLTGGEWRAQRQRNRSP